MIHLHSWDTSNGRKVFILLEELGIPYTYHPIDITRGQQHEPEFLAISPNHKIPAIVDTDGPDGEALSVFESGAILMYLADKAGGELFPADPVRRSLVIQRCGAYSAYSTVDSPRWTIWPSITPLRISRCSRG